MVPFYIIKMENPDITRFSGMKEEEEEGIIDYFSAKKKKST